ncbi:MAG: L-dopachrome tautomerase-related protein, partial [Bacteroidota bacterium]
MQSIIQFLFLVLIFTSCGTPSTDQQSEDTSTDVESKSPQETIPLAETVFSSETVRPCNMAISTSGRMFITINPLTSPDTKVYEINEQDGSFRPYPNETYSVGETSTIQAIIGIKTDSKDQLWLLDMGKNQFIVWDTKAEQLVKTIPIPDQVLTPASFLQDFVIDEKHERVIIADMTQGDLQSAPVPAFIVVDQKTGLASRLAQGHPSLLPEMDGGFGLNPIAIDPNNEWIYFGALHGRTIYRASAS